MPTVALLTLSNLFMTVAWYWHLKSPTMALWKVVLISWGIALIEYSLAVPANRIGFASGMTGGQLKVVQEVVSLSVFGVFAVVYLGEGLRWNHLGAFACLIGAVAFMFAGDLS